MTPAAAREAALKFTESYRGFCSPNLLDAFAAALLDTALFERWDGIKEGLEMAARYHDALVPISTPALRQEHKHAARNIRALTARVGEILT